MFTDKRLLTAYKNAKIEYLNKNSKYIFFSDVHRGDDSVSDEFARNQTILLHALNYYYDHGYTYVEVGDGDELWEYSQFRHIRLAHGDIFSIIQKFYRANRFIMLYGNHNIYLKDPKYVKKNFYYFYDEYTQDIHPLLKGLVPYEALVLKSNHPKQKILVVHGHQGDLFNDQLWYASMIWLRYFWRFLHVFGLQNPSSPAKNHFKRHKIERSYKKWIQKHKILLICGHTHRPKFPKDGELPYFNTGCCIRSKGINGIEIQNGNISMVDWGIHSNEEGILGVKRHIMREPKPLHWFNFRTQGFHK